MRVHAVAHCYDFEVIRNLQPVQNNLFYLYYNIDHTVQRNNNNNDGCRSLLKNWKCSTA